MAALRRPKAEVDRALDAYNQRMTGTDAVAGAADRLALGRLAEAIGRRFDARIWYTLAMQAEPGNAEARTALLGLERRPRTSPVAIARRSRPLGRFAAVANLARGGPSPGTVERREPLVRR